MKITEFSISRADINKQNIADSEYCYHDVCIKRSTEETDKELLRDIAEVLYNMYDSESK